MSYTSSAYTQTSWVFVEVIYSSTLTHSMVKGSCHSSSSPIHLSSICLMLLPFFLSITLHFPHCHSGSFPSPSLPFLTSSSLLFPSLPFLSLPFFSWLKYFFMLPLKMASVVYLCRCRKFSTFTNWPEEKKCRYCYGSIVVSRKRAHSRKSTHPLLWPNFLYRVKVYSNE